ncbi:MAG: hypothetical protein Q8862_02735 [Bacteroidota bacterium]|nr:hypothetical protein [Bacteroidota bacterium]
MMNSIKYYLACLSRNMKLGEIQHRSLSGNVESACHIGIVWMDDIPRQNRIQREFNYSYRENNNNEASNAHSFLLSFVPYSGTFSYASKHLTRPAYLQSSTINSSIPVILPKRYILFIHPFLSKQATTSSSSEFKVGWKSVNYCKQEKDKCSFTANQPKNFLDIFNK